MFRYLALYWPPHHTDAAATATQLLSAWRARAAGWRMPLCQPGFVVWCAGECGDLLCRVLAYDTAVVLGALFDARGDASDDSAPPASALDRCESTVILDSGRRLITHHWGSYVALLHQAQPRTLRVIKDPTGALPCFITSVAGVTVVFSNIVDLTSLAGLRPRVNPAYLAMRLQQPGEAPSQPALIDVTAVRGGECVTLTDGAPRRHDQYWHPHEFIGSDSRLQTAALAATTLRATVRACVHTWVRPHRRLLLRCSGGLDSAIIASCLATAPSRPWLLAYTYNNECGRSDARPWARRVTAALGCEHIEIALRPQTLPLEAALRLPPAVEPTSVLSFYQRMHLESPLVGAHALTAVVSGDGGDSGFGREAIAQVLIDSLRHRGLHRGLFRLATQVARHTHESTAGVLARSLRALIGNTRDTTYDYADQCQLVSRELRQPVPRAPDSLHPWLTASPRPAAEFMSRLGSLLMPSQYYNTFGVDAAPDLIAPLYAQPVIEQLLRIPLEVLFLDGCDRGLARAAFVGDVPDAILQRCWKDRAPGFFEALIAHHRPLLREVLLDGVLVRDHWLDRAAVERALSDAATLRSAVWPGEILRHLDTELWVRHSE